MVCVYAHACGCVGRVGSLCILHAYVSTRGMELKLLCLVTNSYLLSNLTGPPLEFFITTLGYPYLLKRSWLCTGAHLLCQRLRGCRQAGGEGFPALPGVSYTSVTHRLLQACFGRVRPAACATTLCTEVASTIGP